MGYIYIPENFTITDEEFLQAKQAQERVYRDEGGRQADRTYLDPLGHARWDTDYYTLRTRGYAHQAALQEMRCRIREAWQPSPLPALETRPPVPAPFQPPAPPAPPVPTTPDPPAQAELPLRPSYTVRDICVLYLALARQLGFKPNHQTSHDQQMRFLREVLMLVRRTDRRWWMKRASETRPISNEAVVLVEGLQFRCWDIIISAGSPNWVVQAGDPVSDFSIPPQVLVDPVALDSVNPFD